MRSLTNALMFLVALLTVVGLYVLREQSAGSLHQTLSSLIGEQRPAVKKPPLVPKPAPVKPHVVKRHEPLPAPNVEVSVSAVPVEPLEASTIQIGMKKVKLWGEFGKPNAATSYREGERFLETFIYLLDDPAQATVVRLVNGTVVSVKSTRTVRPPLLVPQTNGLVTPVSLASDAM